MKTYTYILAWVSSFLVSPVCFAEVSAINSGKEMGFTANKTDKNTIEVVHGGKAETYQFDLSPYLTPETLPTVLTLTGQDTELSVE